MKLTGLDEKSFEDKIYDKCESCVVVFSRKNCHVCAEVIPMVEEVADEYKDKLAFCYVDVEEQRNLYNRFSLRGVPQIVLFTDGDFKGKLGGLVEEDALKEKLDSIL